MKKILLLLSAFLMLVPNWSSKADGGDVQIPVNVGDGGTNNGGPLHHAPALVPISATYFSSLSSIVASYLYDLGSVTVEIENQTTGEYSQSVVNALAGPMPFIISGTSGHWRISFTLSSGVCYYGEFDI